MCSFGAFLNPVYIVTVAAMAILAGVNKVDFLIQNIILH